MFYAGIHADADSPGVGIASHFIVPQIAILDPDMTRTLPPRGAAITGIDALTHCIEGFLSKEDVPFAKMIALDGLRRGLVNLKGAVRNEDGARMEMLLASYAGGVAMSMGTGPAHAIALSCSDQGFPHGILSGIGIVMTLNRTLERIPEQRAALAAAMGLGVASDLGACFAEIMRSHGLPVSLGQLGYKTDDLEGLAVAAYGHFLNSFAHHPPSLAEYREMLEQSFRQTEP